MLLCGFVIDEPITFHHVQSRSVGRAELIYHGKRPVGLNPNGVNHQHVAFVTAYGIPIPGRRHLHPMRLVHADMTNIIPFVKDRDTVQLLKHLHAVIRKDKRWGLGPTLISGGRKERSSRQGRSLAGCKSPYRQLPVVGRLAYPMRGEVTNRVLLGRKSPGCPAGVFAAVGTIWGASKLGGRNITKYLQPRKSPRTKSFQAG